MSFHTFALCSRGRRHRYHHRMKQAMWPPMPSHPALSNMYCTLHHPTRYRQSSHS
ncbi:hypothetical protein BC629DRAFT_1503953 [Irpex lacteus]|nr:hypothetical protein BC629DRAFT_1503953 [Irpex lacteus]